MLILNKLSLEKVKKAFIFLMFFPSFIQANQFIPQNSQENAIKFNSSSTPDNSKDNFKNSILVFGEQLFHSGFSNYRVDGLNPNYRILPGDQILLRTWGSVEIESLLIVDSQGNVFIPSIGLINIQGMTLEQVNSEIKKFIHRIYPENVSVYINLKGVQPISLFVTGHVKQPGRYAGAPHESILYFINQAQGIDSAVGSYRSIEILRNNTLFKKIDLYDFLLEGKLPKIQFKEGDTLIVNKKLTSISVTGEVKKNYSYEFKSEKVSGAELISLASLNVGATHALIKGLRQESPTSHYLSLNEFKEFYLHNGDHVEFVNNQRNENLIIQIKGSFYGPSHYILPRDTRLQTLLDMIPVPEKLTNVKNISISRESVAKRQKLALLDSLRRLEANYLSASSSTVEEAQIRVQEAQLIKEFVNRASLMEPSGRLVISQDNEIANIRLQNNDIINIPEYSDSLLISGEVLVPQSIVFSPGKNVLDYINSAGGFTPHADQEKILILRQNGEVYTAEHVILRPGDEIIVLSKPPTKNLQLAKSISQILYQIAVAAKVVLDF